MGFLPYSWGHLRLLSITNGMAFIKLLTTQTNHRRHGQNRQTKGKASVGFFPYSWGHPRLLSTTNGMAFIKLLTIQKQIALLERHNKKWFDPRCAMKKNISKNHKTKKDLKRKNQKQIALLEHHDKKWFDPRCAMKKKHKQKS